MLPLSPSRLRGAAPGVPRSDPPAPAGSRRADDKQETPSGCPDSEHGIERDTPGPAIAGITVTSVLRRGSALMAPAKRHRNCVCERRGKRGTAEPGAMSWIDQLIQHLEQVTCSGCGEYYHGGDIAAVVTEPSRLIVRLRCRSCGQDGIAILDFGTNPVAPDPISVDDVIDTHDLLARASRPPPELFPALTG